MNRRQFIRLWMLAVGSSTIAGNAGALGDEENGIPTYEIPAYSQWVPADSQTDPETGVFFTHVDWEELMALDDDEDPADEPDDMDVAEELIESFPIMGLPFYGAFLTSISIFGLLLYPFVEDIFPDEDRLDVAGIDTVATTWTDGLIIFHGNYDRDVFEEQYTDGFTEADQQDGFTVYAGDDLMTEGLAFALSEETVVAGMMTDEEDEYVPEDLMSAALDRTLDDVDRMVDEADGQWLFETTGEAPMTFGVWETDDLREALEPDEANPDETEEHEQDNGGPTADPEVDEEHPVFDDVESLVNNLAFEVVDGEMRDLEARFAGLYPEESVPTEEEIREYLIGVEDAPHEITIEGGRVHVTATFEEAPDENLHILL